MTVETDYTQEAFDSYLDLAAVQTRLETIDGARDEDAWLKTPEPRKEQFLRQATLWIRDFAVYCGARDSSITGLVAVWPRSHVYSPNGNAVASDAVPQFVLDACMYRAIDYAEGLGLPVAGSYEDRGVTIEQKIGALTIKKSPVRQRRGDRATAKSQELNSYAAQLLMPYVATIRGREATRG